MFKSQLFARLAPQAKFALGATSIASIAAAYSLSSNLSAATPIPAFNPKEFQPFKLSESQHISHNTKLFRFDLPSENHVMGLEVASCIATKFKGADGKDVIRMYTPVSRNEETGHFDLIIKKYEGGPMSTHIFDMKKGDSLLVKGPVLKLKYEPNMKKEIGMVAGGTGITPMLQVLREILNNPNDKTKVSLIFANVTEKDILLADELNDLAKKHPNQFKVHYTLDKPESNWKGETGFVSEKMVKDYLPAPSKDTLVFICGPTPMLNHVSGNKAEDRSQGEVGGLLKKAGYTKDMVFKF